jgi:hypothetical protein
MLRVKKPLSGLSALFVLDFLSLFCFTSGTLPWSAQHVSRLLKPASHASAKTGKLYSSARTDERLVLESDGEPKPGSEVVLTAKENFRISRRSLVLSSLYFRTILVPKVSRYIFKSVLNI